MKKVIILMAGVMMSIFLADRALAQLEKGKKELSFGAAFMGIQQEGETEVAFNLSTRLGYFLTKEFEVEPEVIFSVYENEDAGFILNANLLYNPPMPKDTRIFPFFLAGGGWANSVHLFNQINAGKVDRNYTILNLGVGSRFFINNSVSLRFEYRFQRFFTEKEEQGWWGYYETYNPSFNYHNVLFGLSVWF